MINSKRNKFLIGKKILWIEDDEFFSSLMTKKVSETGCILVFITTGEEAVKIASQEKPDLIILDILLPGMNGFKVLEKIKADENLKNIPIIVLSNLGGQENKDRAFDLGVEKYFLKTEIKPSEILNQIELFLKRS